MSRRLRVLHDWDNPYRSRKRCLMRGFQLILYAISAKMGFLRRFSFIKAVYDELHQNALTLAKLDVLVGVDGIIGIKREVRPRFLDVVAELERYGAEVREHIHINLPEGRTRLWVPPLNQSPATWHYDREYVKSRLNVERLLRRDELPIFHVDYPEFLSAYIDWLYWVSIDKGRIYRHNGDTSPA